ncbi:MAG: PDZ domain-containing protein, partial [candidate division Zixibacteria bacterium]|nr:PDZ domain-containing protein [candidate division Zixibacteria bacterium]
MKGILKVILAVLFTLGLGAARAADGPAFDFARIEKTVHEFSVILEVHVEISMGTHTGEQKLRLLGTIVTDDGLIIFNGEGLSDESGPAGLSGMTMKITPVRLTARTLDGNRYEAEFLGVDRFTDIGFGRIKAPAGVRFKSVRFTTKPQLAVGNWLGLYMLLPEFVSPPLAADVGMVSSLIESPEKFVLTMGLGPAQMTSVLFDRNYAPVGVVGSLPDPGRASSDAGGMLQDLGESDIPLIGVISGDRLAKLIASPPLKGKADRSWLGISLQALTKDLGEYMHLPVSQGIIVNEVLRGSPASKAGLAVGDVIYAVDGRTIPVDKDERVSIFQRTVSEMPPGTTVQFSLYRQSVGSAPQPLTVPITLERAPLAATDAPEYEDKTLEFSVRDMVLSDYIANNIVDTTLKGVVVSRMKSGGLAQVGGLRLGDIVQRIGATTVVSVDDARVAMDMVEKQKPSEVVFFVWRDG